MARAFWLTPLLALTIMVAVVVGQSGNTSQPPGKPFHIHSAPQTDFVDGAQHPELIPDSVAYRLYFITVSETASPNGEARSRQLAYLSRAGLKNNDLQWTISILEKFKTKYNELVTQYNQSAALAEKQGGAADYQSFIFQRDDLVRATREDLRSFLTVDGVASLDAHVNNEKRHMKLGLQEAQQ